MSHANMRFRVIVHGRPAEFEKWVEAQQARPGGIPDALAQQGKTLFTQSTCVGCHTITGISAGHIGPDLTHFASRKTFAGLARCRRTPDNLTKWIENPEHMKPGALMPNLGMNGEQSQGSGRLSPQPEIGRRTMATHAAFMPGAKVGGPHVLGVVASWLTTVDHKRIGILYGSSAFIFFLIGGHRGAAHAPAARAARQQPRERRRRSTSCSRCTAPP